MAHRRGGFRGRSVGISQTQRRKKSWLAFSTAGNEHAGVAIATGDTGAAPGSNLGVALITSVDGETAGLVEGTIMRIRGTIDVPKSTVLTTAQSTVVAFGIGFVTDEAGQGLAVPNPATGAGQDWDGWLFYRSNLQGALDANAGIMDSKSMRKWNSGMSLALIAGVSTDLAAGASSQTVSLIVRGLFLRP